MPSRRGTLVRLVMRGWVAAVLQWRGVLGHRQVTAAYLASLARRHRGRIASFDRGLVALHVEAFDIEDGYRFRAGT